MVEYADYQFYKDCFRGDAIPDVATFRRVVLKASVYVKFITSGRVDNSKIPEEVSMATCAVAEEMYKEGSSGQEKKAESVGNYSVTYAENNSLKDRQYNAAYPYLINTGLLYRGC